MPTAHTTTHRIHVLISPSFGRGEGNQPRSLCGTPKGPSSSWPDGHLWIRLEPGGGLPRVVNCPDCIREHGRRIRCPS
jgi:hypothetical protein